MRPRNIPLGLLIQVFWLLSSAPPALAEEGRSGYLLLAPAASDRRVTTNVQPLDGALDTIMRLKPVTFQYIDEYRAGKTGFDGLRRGFIAQEVEPVLPGMVKSVDEAFGDQEIGDFRVITNGGEFVPLLVKAMQELQAENEGLRARLDALERKGVAAP
jgi:hypothetical protein